MAENKRVLVAFAEDTVKELDRMAAASGTTRLDIIRRAMAWYMLMDREISLDKLHRRAAIVDGKKIIETIVWS